jgi:hypothetical protein
MKENINCHCMWFVAGPDHTYDMDRLSVLLHIQRIIDLCGDVPKQLVMYVLSGHDGSLDSRGSQEDTLWKVRDQQYDTTAADAIREKARVARIALRLNPADIFTQSVEHSCEWKRGGASRVTSLHGCCTYSEATKATRGTRRSACGEDQRRHAGRHGSGHPGRETRGNDV